MLGPTSSVAPPLGLEAKMPASTNIASVVLALVILMIPLILASQALRTDIPGMPWTANSIFRLVEGRRKRILSQTDRSRPDRRIAHLPMRNSLLVRQGVPRSRSIAVDFYTLTPVQLAPAGCPISGRMSGSICHGTSTSGPLLPVGRLWDVDHTLRCIQV